MFVFGERREEDVANTHTHTHKREYHNFLRERARARKTGGRGRPTYRQTACHGNNQTKKIKEKPVPAFSTRDQQEEELQSPARVAASTDPDGQLTTILLSRAHKSFFGKERLHFLLRTFYSNSACPKSLLPVFFPRPRHRLFIFAPTRLSPFSPPSNKSTQKKKAISTAPTHRPPCFDDAGLACPRTLTFRSTWRNLGK